MHATRASHTLGCRVEGLRLRASGLGLRGLGSELYSTRCGSNQREPQRPAAETAISGTGTREQAHPRRSHRPRSQAGEDCNGTRHANRREMLSPEVEAALPGPLTQNSARSSLSSYLEQPASQCACRTKPWPRRRRWLAACRTRKGLPNETKGSEFRALAKACHKQKLHS